MNRTHAGYEGYEAMMFIFGFPWGIVNLVACLWYFAWAAEGLQRTCKSGGVNFLFVLFHFFVGVPVALMLIILPFFGGWIITPIAQSVSCLRI